MNPSDQRPDVETITPHKRGPRPGTDAARRGGRAAANKYGSAFYREIGKKGGTRVKEQLGSEHYTRIGRMGGEATKQRLGHDHYARIGKLGGSRSTRGHNDGQTLTDAE